MDESVGKQSDGPGSKPDSNNNRRGLKQSYWQRFRRSTVANQANVIFSCLITVATISYAIVAAIQLHVMRQASSDSTVQTGQLITAANINAVAAKQIAVASGRNAAAAESFAMSAQEINKGISDAVTKLKLQVDKLGDNAQQATRLATATETANKNAANTDRPWFGAMLSVEGFEVGKVPVATIQFINSGRRPAKIILSESHSNWFSKFPDIPPYEFDGTPSGGVAVPNFTVTNRFNVLKKEMSQLEFDTAQAGLVTFFIYSNIEYVDLGTGNKHFTHSCWRYIGNNPILAKGFYGCNEYQDAN